MFGPHLIIDGSRCDTRKLADRNLVEQVLTDYPAAIGMTKIGGPYMFEYQAPDPAYSGVSGLVVIAESHIAIHTFPELDYFTMDVFSCKNFDHEKAIAYIRDAFDVKEMDRMLVQRGLSFRGPHHGRNGATDELIEAAEERLKAGIVSKEPALPDEDETAIGLHDEREAALARRSETPAASGGRMIWPQYGMTPDYGSYGEVACEPCAHDGARVVALASSLETPIGREGQAVPTSEPVQVNPTASISGLLDKMAATGGQGRALGRALAAWERLVRDDEATIALALSAPVIAEGLRETLVYTLEQRYADVLVVSADDLFADLYESLGYLHFADGLGVVAVEEGRAKARAFFTQFLAEVDVTVLAAPSELWRRFGAYLPKRVPRKGVLQAAARQDIRIFTPDLATSTFGSLLLAARAQGMAIALDSANDVIVLARTLAEQPRLGILRVAEGAADALLAQARELAGTLNIGAPNLMSHVTLGAARNTADGEVYVASDASLTLPLLATGLAQRCPGIRTGNSGGHEQAAMGELHEPALP
ncbi:MAG TPA: adenosylmethionine decarboxylase [Ktedonobacterales bacterium]|nr:adenosylmethionine decarboxylase [Ktedonobacterales bacterium]